MSETFGIAIGKGWIFDIGIGTLNQDPECNHQQSMAEQNRKIVDHIALNFAFDDSR